MSESSGFYPRPAVDTPGTQIESQAGGILLTETIRAVGLDQGLAVALQRLDEGAGALQPAIWVLSRAPAPRTNERCSRVRPFIARHCGVGASSR